MKAVVRGGRCGCLLHAYWGHDGDMTASRQRENSARPDSGRMKVLPVRGSGSGGQGSANPARSLTRVDWAGRAIGPVAPDRHLVPARALDDERRVSASRLGGAIRGHVEHVRSGASGGCLHPRRACSGAPQRPLTRKCRAAVFAARAKSESRGLVERIPTGRYNRSSRAPGWCGPRRPPPGGRRSDRSRCTRRKRETARPHEHLSCRRETDAENSSATDRVTPTRAQATPRVRRSQFDPVPNRRGADAPPGSDEIPAAIISVAHGRHSKTHRRPPPRTSDSTWRVRERERDRPAERIRGARQPHVLDRFDRRARAQFGDPRPVHGRATEALHDHDGARRAGGHRHELAHRSLEPGRGRGRSRWWPRRRALASGTEAASASRTHTIAGPSMRPPAGRAGPLTRALRSVPTRRLHAAARPLVLRRPRSRSPTFTLA
jgi:hypothetical protein